MEHSNRPLDPEQRSIQDEALRWVVRLHSGEASTDDYRAFARWRSLSPFHEASYQEAQALWGLGSGLRLDRATGRVMVGRAAPARSAWQPLALAALLLAAIMGAGIYGGLFRGVMHDYATGTGEIRTVTLPDGSVAALNARSSIDVDFSSTRRRVVLSEGQAYFEVAKDAARPFEVEAERARVTALGTAFDVEIGAGADQVAIAVTQHAVEVASRGDDVRPAPVQVPEGQAVIVEADGAIGAVTPSDPQTAVGWRKGLLIAEAKPLREVIAALRRYHPGWIVFDNAALGGLSVSAVLELRDPNHSLDTLAAGLPIQVRHISPYLTLISAR